MPKHAVHVSDAIQSRNSEVGSIVEHLPFFGLVMVLSVGVGFVFFTTYIEPNMQNRAADQQTHQHTR